MGAGKAGKIDNPVLTPNGWVTLGALQVGDKVYGADGKPCNVIGVYPQGKRQVYRVWFKDNVYIDCDAEHLWCVNTSSRKYHNYPYQVKTTQQLIKEGVSSKNINGKDGTTSKWFIPVVQPVEFEKRELKIPPYAMGALLGNGSFCDRWIHFSTADEETVQRLRLLLSDITIKYMTRFGYQLMGGRQNTVWHALDFYGLIGKHANTKFIPHDYLFSSIEDRLELLRGLMDTDGTVSKSRRKKNSNVGNIPQYCTVSPQLRDDVIHLVRSLGGIAKYGTKSSPQYTYNNEVRHGQTAYNIFISLPDGMQPFHLTRKKELYNCDNRKYKPNRPIRKIEVLEDEAEMVCIAVDSPDHCYVTDHFVVTHNTIQAIKYIVDAKTFPAIVVCPATLKLNWQREFMTHFGKRTVVLSGGKPHRLLPDRDPVYIINYDVLAKWEKEIIKLKPAIIVADECFVAGTMVSTPSGDIPIEDIQVGQLVFNAFGIGRVDALSVKRTSKLLQIGLSNGKQIRCTENHPFFTETGEVRAVELVKGSGLCDIESLRNALSTKTNAGQEELNVDSVKVESITTIETDGSEIVYNLQVNGHPSYYANGVLVHNCHYAKSVTATRTKALMRLARHVLHFIGISGTPMTNHPTELYPILRMILGEDGIESRREFCDRYSKLVLTRFGFRYEGARRLPELHKRLVKSCMIRRLIEDVLPDLPEKTRQTIPITLPAQNMKEYKEMVGMFEQWYRTNFPDRKAVETRTTLMLVKLGYLKRMVALWKLPQIFEWIDNFLEQSEEKLVVFGLHRQILDGIVERYSSRGNKQHPFVVKIDGTVSMPVRQIAVDLFQNRPETRLFVGQMRAAGVGITLTASHHVLFAECDFVPAVHLQAEDRCRRISQKNHVLCTYLVAENTIEYHVCDILQRKQATFQSVMDGGKNVDTLDMVQELLKRMSGDLINVK
jgi:hypothetical protein